MPYWVEILTSFVIGLFGMLVLGIMLSFAQEIARYKRKELLYGVVAVFSMFFLTLVMGFLIRKIVGF